MSTHKQSTKLKADLERLSERRAQIQRELETAIQENDGAQADLLINALPDATQAATMAFARVEALKVALNTLDSEIEKGEGELEAAITWETQTAQRARREQCEREIDEALSEYRAARIEAHEALERILPGAVAAWNRVRSLHYEHGELCRSLGEHNLLQINRLGDGVENLKLGHWIDEALNHLSRLAQQGTPAERKALITERSRQRAETAARLDRERNEKYEGEEQRRRNFLGSPVRVVRNPGRAA